MKKKILIPIIAAAILLAVLFVPIPQGSYDDGGTREWIALTYKIVKWRRMLGTGEEYYDATRVYVFPSNFKSLSALWEAEGVDVGTYEKPEPEEVEVPVCPNWLYWVIQEMATTAFLFRA